MNRDLPSQRPHDLVLPMSERAAAFDLRDLRLIEPNAVTRDAAQQALVRDLAVRGQAREAATVPSQVFGLPPVFDGVLILFLFASGFVLSENEQTLAIVKPADAQPLTILCADDHTLVGDALAKVFTTAGYVVLRADDGEVAWERFSSSTSRIDVVITDHDMPRLNGHGLVARLRDADYPGRIIVYSSSLREEDIARYRSLAVDAIVVKAPDAARLLAVVEAFHGEAEG